MSYCEECGKIQKASPIVDAKKAMRKSRSILKDMESLVNLMNSINDDNIQDAILSLRYTLSTTSHKLKSDIDQADRLIRGIK